MSLSRWKMMAGVLGVSIGGLAAAASQCPKLDTSKGRSPEEPVAKADAPKLPPAGAPSVAPTLDLPPVPAGLAVPAAPNLVPAGPTPPGATVGLPPLPDFPFPLTDVKSAKPAAVTPIGGTLPPLPTPPAPSAPASKPSDPVKPATPAAPVADLIPPPAAAPSVPQPATKPTTPSAPSAGPDGRGVFGTPMFTGPGGDPLPLNPPTKVSPPAVPPSLPADPLVIDVPPGKPTAAPAADSGPPKVAEGKFRILLRVGEGEPTFEVKNGDNLVLKVACEKVDIESADKGTGLSKVTARGKVRFAGFGAEGSCDSLSFMAGTGEVQMTGDVKVQVKDKLGRVESELTTATLKYKLDASAVGGALKP